MTAFVRHLALGLLLAGAMLSGAALTVPAAFAQTSCESSYPDFCIPPAWEIGDLDGIDTGTVITVYPPDSHWFDGDYDGIGREWW